MLEQAVLPSSHADDFTEIYKVEISRYDRDGQPIVVLRPALFRRIFDGQDAAIEKPYSAIATTARMYIDKSVQDVGQMQPGGQPKIITVRFQALIPLADLVSEWPLSLVPESTRISNSTHADPDGGAQ
tara:strand:+ start:2074 stop:2457 length:384 start_codon:yes stop_codon:yes gene_type:complete